MNRAGGKIEKPVPIVRLEKDRGNDLIVLFFVGIGRGLWLAGKLVVLLLRYPFSTGLAAFLVWLDIAHGERLLCAAVVGLVVAGGVWAWRGRVSFAAWVLIPWLSRLRGYWVYTWHWETALAMCGLTVDRMGEHYLPHLRRVICDDAVDRVYLRLAKGQTPADFEDAAESLAHAFGALSCQIVSDGPGRLWLVFTRKDRLGEVVPAMPVPERLDLTALPVGRRQDVMAYPRRLDPLRRKVDAVLPTTGRLVALLRGLRIAGASGAGELAWTVRLLGTHILIAGATGAGKGSVLWSIIRALGGGVRAGLVQLWVIDPKGGMELSFGLPLFHRFCYGDDQAADPDKKRSFETAFAEFLEELVAEMRRRQSYLRGRSRLHKPSPGDPSIVVIIDELASLTAYVVDRDAKKRIATALQLLLSQGRAVGVLIVAAVQDPRKEVVPDRGLFPTRIALRLNEEDETDLVLGKAARKRGAACHEIPENTPGVGYVVLDGVREPARVRAGHVTDDDITAMVAHPAAPDSDVVRPFPAINGDIGEAA